MNTVAFDQNSLPLGSDHYDLTVHCFSANLAAVYFCGRVISARMETARCCFTSFLHENPHFLPYRNHGSNGRSGDVEGLHGDEEFYDEHITRVRRMLASLSIKRAVRSPRSLPVVGLSCPFWHPLITRICPASAR